MTTKEKYHLCGINHIEKSNQFSNFNLNQNQKCSDTLYPFHAYNKSNIDKNSGHTVLGHGYQEIKKSWNKSIKNLCLKIPKNFNINEEIEENVSQKYWKNDKNISNNKSSSTLSLHILAYENSIEAVSTEPEDLTKTSKTFKSAPKYQIFQDRFEFPRQMDGNKSSAAPQIQQFKASQNLFVPNQAPPLSSTMPDEIVWVDKVLNPRSAVLTHNEAMTVLKNAKNWISRPRQKAPILKPHGSEKKLSLAQQKDEYIKLQKMFLQQDEMKPILEMQAELEAIEASKEVYRNAIEERYIYPDGLPRLKPSTLLKKELVRSKKIKGNEVAEKLALLDKSAINKNALKRILDNDNDDDTKDGTPMEVDSPRVTPKLEVDENEKSEVKRRRIIISDDETDDEEASKDSKVSIQLLPQEPSESAMEFSNDRREFKAALSRYNEFIEAAPITFCFEATKEETKVLALTEEIKDVLEDNETPTNVMFTNYAVSGTFKLPAKEEDEKKPDELLRSFLLGDSDAKELGATALTNSIKPPSNLGKSDRPNYNELIKDENFCSKLLNSCEADWDVSSYFELDSEYRAKDSEYLPKLQTLNSLFCAFDLDLLQYQADVAVINASRVRERQRVQHPTIKVRPTKKPAPLFDSPKGTVTIAKSSSLPNSMTRNSSGSKAAASSVKQEGGDEMKTCIAHNTVIHEALKYLEKSQTAHRYQTEIKDAYKKLSKYPLTFLEKMNLIQTSPKDLPGMLCVLDDLGLRFSKEVLDNFEKDCSSLWIPKRQRIKRNSTTL